MANRYLESVQQIAESYAEVPVELVYSHPVGRLEMGELPGDLPTDQIDDMEQLAAAWADELNSIWIG